METGRLPEAHTCYNTLTLPPYESPAELRTRLLTAMDEAKDFGQE